MSKHKDPVIQEILDKVTNIEEFIEDYTIHIMPLLTKNEQLRANVAKLGLQGRRFERSTNRIRNED